MSEIVVTFTSAMHIIWFPALVILVRATALAGNLDESLTFYFKYECYSVLASGGGNFYTDTVGCLVVS